MANRVRYVALLLASTTMLSCPVVATAQTQTAPATPSTTTSAPSAVDTSPTTGEIIVTARKRDETLISVPVVVSAVSGAMLEKQGITNLDGVARIVPQLLIGPQGGAVQGGNISIRGISGADQNPFGDQAVSFNIDGVQVAKASVRRMSDFDTGQIEVLKGPQALFFGKNSPAGIISIRTADPTSHFEAGVKTDYEINAHEIRTEAYVSGPATETLEYRVAGFYDHMRGYITDLTPLDSPYRQSAHNPDGSEYGIRTTLKWKPSDKFNARFKFNYGHLDQDGPAALQAFLSCQSGARQTGSGIDQCTANGTDVNAGYGSFVSTIPSPLNHFRADGDNFMHQQQILTGLEMNYELSEHLSLTSVTGYYGLNLDQCQNYENDTAIILPSCNQLHDHEFSQELRFSTNYNSPVNFTGGVYYSHTNATTTSYTFLFGGDFDLLGPGFGGPTTPALVDAYEFQQIGNAYSAYLQTQFKPIDEIEIDAGGRYSKEYKRLPMVRTGGGLNDGLTTGTGDLTPATEVPSSILGKRNDNWNDFSPEVTVSYRPSTNFTLFGSYKHGFLSGGFNSGSVSFNPTLYPSGSLDLSYKPQTVKGFEAGLKAIMFDRSLRFNLAAYTYTVSDQQVSVVFDATNTISNAGASQIKGVEADFTYRTPLKGLTVNGNAAYNDGKYTSYANAPCYGGQTFATGCNGGLVASTGQYTTQDLSNTELIRAPKWNLGGGFDYTTPIDQDWNFNLNGNITHSSSFLTDASSAPTGREPKYTLVDASARVTSATGNLEFAVIGRNLGNTYYYVATSLVPFVTSDRFGSISRGREVRFQVAYKFK